MLALPAVFSVDAVLAVVGVVLVTCLTVRIYLGQRGAKPAPSLNQKFFRATFHNISPTEARKQEFLFQSPCF